MAAAADQAVAVKVEAAAQVEAVEVAVEATVEAAVEAAVEVRETDGKAVLAPVFVPLLALQWNTRRVAELSRKWATLLAAALTTAFTCYQMSA